MASVGIVGQIAAGFAIAFVIALAAYKARSLSRSGALAATLVGTASVAAGWPWGALLVIYFVASSALSRFRRADKEKLTAGMVEKGGARDATQVIANGGVFAAAAVAIAVARAPIAAVFAMGALGALATATADTWATEIGTLFGGVPRSVLTFRPVARGASGGITLAGTIAMIAGAAFIAYVSLALGLTRAAPLVLLAGIVGALVDSVLGATVQERRWCASCEQSTERGIHHCGAATTRVAGYASITNDMVNLLATMTGFAVAVLGLVI